MKQEDFFRIAKQLDDALPSIFDAYIDAGRGPSDEAADALSEVVGGSRNEFKKRFARYARSKGSNLFFGHYPAFDEDGCEFERPA